MKELNKARNSFLMDRIDFIDLWCLVIRRINELKKCQKDCQLTETKNSLKLPKIK